MPMGEPSPRRHRTWQMADCAELSVFRLKVPAVCRSAAPIMRQLTPDTPLDLNISLSDGETYTQGGNPIPQDIVTLL